MQTVIMLCTLVTGIAAVVNIFSLLHQKVKSPEKLQNDRIQDLEQYAQNDKHRIELLEKHYNRVDSVVEKLSKQTAWMKSEMTRQKEQMDIFENGECVTHNALLAIMDFMVTMNNSQDKSELVAARNDLHRYLVKK